MPIEHDRDRVSPSSSATSLGRSRRIAATLKHARDHRAADEHERASDVQEQQPVVAVHARLSLQHRRRMDVRERHLRLLTETIAAVNSTLDLEEVLALVARKVAEALDADACFVYLYDERADELVLRATHGTSVEEMTRRPRMRPGEGITGRGCGGARAGDDPVAGAPRPALQALPEPAGGRVRVDPRRADPRARAARGRAQRPDARSRASSREDEIELLLAIAAQVAQSIEHAKLYAEAQRRVDELEALARISEAVSESLYLEESLEAIVKTTMEARRRDRRRARARGRQHRVARGARRRARRAPAAALEAAGRSASSSATATRRSPSEDRALLASIAHHAAVALEHGAR